MWRLSELSEKILGMTTSPAAVPSFADKPTLSGELVKLRPVGPGDVPGLVELLHDPESIGRGYGTEATRLILDHAFDVVGLNRVELEVYDFNPRARHVYEKVGFIHEGTKRKALYWDGRWVDTHLMAMLAEDRH
jgi:RimJ/RimL family protein N-acetyltransferase